MNPNSFTNHRNYQTNAKICRYGLNCRKQAQGHCTFYHPENANHQNSHHMSQKYEHSRGLINRFPRSKSKNHNNNNNQNGFYQQRNNNFMNKNSQVCFNFHHGEECPHNPCKFKHQFIYNKPEAIQRYFYFRGIPQGFNKLSRIQVKDKIFFIIRSNSKIIYFQYCPLNNSMSPASTILEIEQEISKRNFYNHYENYIYYSFQNKNTSCYSMGIYNISTSELRIVENCHTAPITGIIHYNDQVLLSSCMDGKLKYWNITQDNITINQNSTLFLQNKINPHNNQISVLFININIIKDIKIISIGLTDGKLGLFIVLSEEELNYRQLQFDRDQDSHILKAKLRQTSNSLMVYVLSWSKNKDNSSILSMNINEQTCKPKRIISYHQKDKVFVHLEIIEKFLIVGNMKGQIMLYGLEDQQIKGIIINRNSIADILQLTINLQETGVQMKFIGVLQENDQNSSGSIGIYKLL